MGVVKEGSEAFGPSGIITSGRRLVSPPSSHHQGNTHARPGPRCGPHTRSLLNVHHGDRHIHWKRIFVATLGGHLVLERIEMNIHVARANMSCVLEVCRVADHGAVDSPPPLRSRLLSHAACEALDPDVSHSVAGQLLAGPTFAAASSALRHCLCRLHCQLHCCRHLV